MMYAAFKFPSFCLHALGLPTDEKSNKQSKIDAKLGTVTCLHIVARHHDNAQHRLYIVPYSDFCIIDRLSTRQYT
jgi:hypothetical protein